MSSTRTYQPVLAAHGFFSPDVERQKGDLKGQRQDDSDQEPAHEGPNETGPRAGESEHMTIGRVRPHEIDREQRQRGERDDPLHDAREGSTVEWLDREVHGVGQEPADQQDGGQVPDQKDEWRHCKRIRWLHVAYENTPG